MNDFEVVKVFRQVRNIERRRRAMLSDGAYGPCDGRLRKALLQPMPPVLPSRGETGN